MRKDRALTRRSTSERSAAASVRRMKHGSRLRSTADRELETGHKVTSLIAKRQDLSPLTSWVAAQVFQHVRIERLRTAFADTHQLIRKYPLQAVFVGVGLGCLLSRSKMK